MKKLFSILMLALTCNAFAANTNLQAFENDPGVIDFVWQADTSLSFAYDIALARFDTAEYTATYFAELASYDYAFTIEGYPGYLTCSSDLMLKYGDNYTTIGNYGASAEIVASWQVGWVASVASETEYTLNPGYYVIFVQGVDESFSTTEATAYVITEIADKTQGVTLDIDKIQLIDKNGKYLDRNGQIYILKEGHIYNLFGSKLK